MNDAERILNNTKKCSESIIPFGEPMEIFLNMGLRGKFRRWETFLKTADPKILVEVVDLGCWTVEWISKLQEYLRYVGGDSASALAADYLRSLTLRGFIQKTFERLQDEMLG